MLLHYLNGASVVLGQWAIALAPKCFCIYEIEDEASLSSLYFKTSKLGSHHQIVTGISPSRSALEKTNEDDQVFEVERVFFFSADLKEKSC
jgi:hypothetical protein